MIWVDWIPLKLEDTPRDVIRRGGGAFPHPNWGPPLIQAPSNSLVLFANYTTSIVLYGATFSVFSILRTHFIL